MKKANPYLSNRASIFISIVAALRSVAEGDKIERGQIDGWRRKVHLPASQAEGGRARQALMEFVWPLLRPKCILRLGSEWVAAWSGGTARQSGLCAWKLGLLASRSPARQTPGVDRASGLWRKAVLFILCKTNKQNPKR